MQETSAKAKQTQKNFGGKKSHKKNLSDFAQIFTRIKSEEISLIELYNLADYDELKSHKERL